MSSLEIGSLILLLTSLCLAWRVVRFERRKKQRAQETRRAGDAAFSKRIWDDHDKFMRQTNQWRIDMMIKHLEVVKREASLRRLKERTYGHATMRRIR